MIPTALVVLTPGRWLGQDALWQDVDLVTWSADVYQWDQDDFGGWLDLVQAPRRTYETGDGDCEDYALVAASVLVARGVPDVHIGVVGSGWRPQHVVATGGGRVYSSGRIYEETTFDDYLAASRYTWGFTRRVR